MENGRVSSNDHSFINGRENLDPSTLIKTGAKDVNKMNCKGKGKEKMEEEDSSNNGDKPRRVASVYGNQICIFKMDISCCKECPIKLEKKLMKSNGVKFVAIDQNQGTVTISGDIDPVILLEKLKKTGKEVQLWSFQKEPHQDKEDDKSSNNVAECESDKHFDQHLRHKCIAESKDATKVLSSYPLRPTMNSNVYEHSMWLPQPRYRPMSMYYGSMNSHKLRPANGYYSQLPPPQRYPNYWSWSQPRANPMIHYCNYEDNYNYNHKYL